MKEITDISNFTAEKGSVVTIGTFDGIHLGHQKIIKKLVENAKKQDLLATIFTFFPHPRMIIQKDDSLKLIHTLEEKKQMLESLGVDQLVICPFNESFSKMSAEKFVEELLVNRLKAKKVIIGYDHRFGKNRNADINDMKLFGKKFGFEVEEIPAQEINEVSVSSTKIRQALHEGDVKKAWEYLGTPFCIKGKVVHGLKIGRTIGFPTANIQVKESYKIIPKDGIYLVYSIFSKKKIYGMMSIGKNPTIEGKGATIEVYYFDFKQDIYENNVTIYFLEHLRDEQKFESVEKLKEQLQIDEITSRKLIKENFLN
ncbi:bifunctional riboflavin kinase/FAD synthetase [Capnocytophaga cynodegmi]|uniref:Riboflavin biosynthesis protein n=1 Tax=Capnocytophaga cynodegmi TaxID=28189 RepID=A0A0B7HQI1_9FLAO|nr:bifunctional riboflavin kinase/FAD synthetase [Capnocytophaga cynodegmi]CEN35219.1 Riboflavin biosynthesis protein RibF [Capnocytophaga cynodegmi]CEN41565.1 Riboflavin biosynthesis protein RibF [Capnocytophaga cynodegmi]